MSDHDIPAELRYTADHEWIQRVGESTIRVGITDFAQNQLGDVVFVQLPEIGSECTANEPFCEIESTKSVSDIYAPITGVVAEANEALEASTELVNGDPYGEGWIAVLRAVDEDDLEAQLADTLDADGYRKVIGG